MSIPELGLKLVKSCLLAQVFLLPVPVKAAVSDADRPAMACSSIAGKRTVCADVAALDQTLVYNRFGSFNPFGMMYALRRDLSAAAAPPLAVDADACGRQLGTEPGTGPLDAGAVRLKDCKRPRPLVLRANVGDILHLRLTNLLRETNPGFSETFCRQGEGNRDGFFRSIRNWVSQGPDDSVAHGEAACVTGSAARQTTDGAPDEGNWPRTRGLNFAIQGLTAVNEAGEQDGIEPACTGLAAVAPGEAIDCYYQIDREGPYFMASTAAPSGGEGDGGSITHGLFGAVVVEKKGTGWYRSQVSRGAFDAVWGPAGTAPHARDGAQVADIAAYEKAAGNGVPILKLTMERGPNAHEIVHSDLNAIVYRPQAGDRPATAFREFSVFFHDELKSFYTRNFEELASSAQLAGVRDGFAINYGASGMGSILLANRKGIGPSANCMECLYEEFFLTSWANGDPALLENFADDPSNVHHSYLNDEVVFRNFHAGPKETHVFHLHAHQWFSGNDNGRGSYLDSQTVAPQQGFTYNIYHGGMRSYAADEQQKKGWWGTLGSGNRNRTIGDSIFHCHLYPHFAQGMWELWRVHDVLEDGSRRLPDGQLEPGLSLAEVFDKTKKRRGSVDPETGRRIVQANGEARFVGTPVPALVPLPGHAWPLLPTYPQGDIVQQADGTLTPPQNAQEEQAGTTMPGYPFYVAGKPGHRPPQAPMDIARAVEGHELPAGEYLDGGLPRHVVTDNAGRELPFKLPAEPVALPADIQTQADALASDTVRKREKQQSQVVAKALALGDLTAHLTSSELTLLDYDGTPLEKAAMGFHANGVAWQGPALSLRKADGSTVAFDGAAAGYPSLGTTPGATFFVNGSAPKPGAPFADPCGAPRLSQQDPGEQGGDPFIVGGSSPFWPDPAVSGYRRYEASAVELDLVTNRAGWHDPQARINVLTANSDHYKDGEGRISPRISASEQPFFFRALSGECIEFRHTNELPKELELDDFQVRTPTDTIGQHIHLVKFDVTSSDGSGNGFNYEDGTLAPDEIAARICAALTAGMEVKATRAAGELALLGAELCEQVTENGHQVYKVKSEHKQLWRKKRSEQPRRFQTTVQRWFADPILSGKRSGDDGGAQAGNFDRTMRTVFTHDHFGPSSIQQHGFYSALVIEPARARICDPAVGGACTQARGDRSLQVGDANWVGTNKRVEDPGALDPESVNYREFALAVADFATLYDPRDSETAADLDSRLSATADGAETSQGMETLACEARHAADPDRMQATCGSALARDDAGWFGAPGDVPPAWAAAGRPGDAAEHRADLLASLMTQEDSDALRTHLVEYRRMAAGYARDDASGRLAKPVAPPQRPESISVDHHDPYLVNYFGEPLPLRVGASSSGGECALKPLPHWVSSLETGVRERCSIDMQKPFPQGDMANVFLSSLHGDPATPVWETYTSDRVMFRLIQGAQEVQHTFTLEGYNWPRNVDQRFASGMVPLDDDTPLSTHWKACQARVLKREGLPDTLLSGAGRPDQYHQWLRQGPQSFPAPVDRAYWEAYENYMAECLNVEGRIAAQEVGISEHFEFAAAYRNDLGGAERFAPASAQAAATTEARLAALRALTPSDTLQHFGSVDALWNGAWSLLRVYKDQDARDGKALAECAAFGRDIGDGEAIRACLESKDRIGKRLQPLPRGGAEAAARPDDDRPATPTVFGCRIGAPVVHATAIAIEARRVFGRSLPGQPDTGTPYGQGLYDRNGLFLAMVDPRRVAASPPAGTPWADWLEREGAWTNIDASRVVVAVRQAYSRPEPYVLNVRAGDCVKLTIVNALEEFGGNLPVYRDRKGLIDDLGDAPMPRIVPLNVEPDWAPDEAVGGEEHANRPLRFVQADRSNIRPSARFALDLPLPVLNHQQDVSRPTGWNRKGALAPSRTGRLTVRDSNVWSERAANIEQLTFYAGRVGVPEGFDPDALPAFSRQDLLAEDSAPVRDIQLAFADAVLARLDLAVPVLEVRRAVAGSARTLNVNGAGYEIHVPQNGPPVSIEPLFANDPALRDDVLRLWNDYVRQLYSASVHWMPYAFGALPMKSSGDVIGHGVHGLFGAVVVNPRHAGFSGNDGMRLEPLVATCDEATREGCVHAAVRGSGERDRPTWAVRYTLDGQDGAAHRVREFTLFWQDGLNLRDTASRDRWVGRDTATGTPLSPRLVSDCAVCDDSYDLGEAGVNYRAAPFHVRLRDEAGSGGDDPPERHFNLNAYDFGLSFYMLRDEEASAGRTDVPVLRAEAGDEVVIHVVHPGGRARQRAFVTIGQDYDDLFPGFGFPHSALLAPGKAMHAALTKPLAAGCYLWFDGPTPIRAAGAWGLLDVVPDGAAASATMCRRADGAAIAGGPTAPAVDGAQEQ